MTLTDYGWNDFFAKAFAASQTEDLLPGRVIAAASGFYRLMTEDGELQATLAGKISHAASSAAETPTVGDWVGARAIDQETARIELLLERRSKLSRRAAGKRTAEQVVAANVDTVLIVMGLDGDYNPRRLERLLTAVHESGSRPVVLLNKVDLCPEVDDRRLEIESLASDTNVLVSSCKAGTGIDAVRAEMRPAETAVLIGSSGVGKSTLINLLLGEQVQKTRQVRAGDDRGKHTTTHRELFRLSCGGLIIDNPGIRELQLWGGEQSLEQSFDDIAALAARCRYPDCGHDTEPDCAVQQALACGELEASRIDSYRELQKELRYQELRRSESAQRIEKKKWRNIHKDWRRSTKYRRQR